MPLLQKTPSMRLILNHKRFVRAALLVFAATIIVALTGLWQRRPRLDSNGFPSTGAWPLWSFRKAAPEFYEFETTSHFFPVALEDAETKTVKELCASFPRYTTHRIQPVLKMGYGENRDKIQAQMDSVSACFTNEELLIFSDLAETFRGHDVMDILADLPEAFRFDNPDFQHYTALQEMQQNGTLATDKDALARINGWQLDKYKFIPMVERAWAMRPGRDWYVFYETDTYVVWDNMFRFLSTLDPGVPLYMGSPSPGRYDEKQKFKTWFANGGPGFVLSRAAIEKLLYRKSNSAGRLIDPPPNLEWLDLLREECCGDSVMGWILWNAGIPLSGFYPMFNPYPLHGIPYTRRFWCQPALTLHKTTPEDMVKLWRWEHSRRKRGEPLLYSDLIEFSNPGHPATLSDWDNGDLDRFYPPPGANVGSFDSCGATCQKHSDCFQWLWRGQDVGECILMRSIRYGIPRKPGIIEEHRLADDPMPPPPPRKIDYKSGWVTGRIDEWKARTQCRAAQWVNPSITRVF